MTFLNKSYGEWSTIDKHIVVPTSYDDDDEEKEKDNMVSTNNSDMYCYNVVSNSESVEET